MRRHQLAMLLGHALLACASAPEPRPAGLDPSNPGAPEAPAIAPLEAFTSGPRTLDEPLLPPLGPDSAPTPPQEEPDGHDGHEGHAP